MELVSVLIDSLKESEQANKIITSSNTAERNTFLGHSIKRLWTFQSDVQKTRIRKSKIIKSWH